MEEEKKENGHEEEHSHEHHNKKINLTEKFRENPWVLSTLICGVLVLALLFVAVTGGITGNTIFKNKIGDLAISFLNEDLLSGSTATLVSVKELSGIYEIDVSISGADVPLYFTKDGKWIEQGAELKSISASTSSSNSNPKTEVIKSDRPSVELYIWSYCPYGVAALSPLSEVASLLKDSADFKVKLYYAGHGDFEVQQNKIQACIQKLAPTYYWDYAKTFASDIYTKCSGDIACDLKESTALMKKLGIDSSAVLSCVSSQGKTLIDADSVTAQAKGVKGSPTLVINGAQVSASRTAEAYKSAICSAFTNGNIPTECSETLSSTGTTASGNC